MQEMPGDNRVEGEGAASSEQAPAKAKATRKSPATRSRRKTGVAAKAAPEAASSAEVTSITNGLPKAAKPSLLEMYFTQVVPTMMQEFAYRNVMEVPRLRKVVLNIGLGEALTNAKAIESASADLATISGQKPIVTRAKNSIAGFKLRKGNPIGVCVTLRGARMYHFMNRLVNAALPRTRDFRGISPQSFDGRGNYSLGIREQIIFPEIDYGQIERIRGLQVCITTTAKTDAEAARLLALFGMPFAQEN